MVAILARGRGQLNASTIQGCGGWGGDGAGDGALCATGLGGVKEMIVSPGLGTGRAAWVKNRKAPFSRTTNNIAAPSGNCRQKFRVHAPVAHTYPELTFPLFLAQVKTLWDGCNCLFFFSAHEYGETFVLNRTGFDEEVPSDDSQNEWNKSE